MVERRAVRTQLSRETVIEKQGENGEALQGVIPCQVPDRSGKGVETIRFEEYPVVMCRGSALHPNVYGEG